MLYTQRLPLVHASAETALGHPLQDVSSLTQTPATTLGSFFVSVIERMPKLQLNVHLTHQEDVVLQFLGKQGAEAGQFIPSRTLWRRWGSRADVADLWAGIAGLVAKKVVAANAADTEYALTAMGVAWLNETSIIR